MDRRVSLRERLLTTLGHSCNNAVVFDVVRVIGLDVGGETVECSLE
jgi:hypothetical protein